ncbi:helix-turn-helix domain-containing protein [Mangrovimonas cancribranchiae]|uniref:Helix-turn-helix domain-containing protein n=1 Tax=Mangrovimonas cancribranchiae TaxID=3080055 RepID=A0AAU6NX14_9FLAO
MKKSIIQIETTSSSEFIPKLAAEIRKVIKEESNHQESNQILLTREQVAEMLSISLVTLWKYTKKGVIPAFRIGTKVRYKKGDVILALKKMNNF